MVGVLVFWLLYRHYNLYNSKVMAVFFPLTAPFIIIFLLFFSVCGSRKKIKKSIPEREAGDVLVPESVKRSKERRKKEKAVLKNKIEDDDFDDILLEEAKKPEKKGEKNNEP